MVNNAHEKKDNTPTIVVISTLAVAALIALAMYGLPLYWVYSQRLHGQAEYQRAVGNRQIRVQEAEAKLEAARLEAEAEVAKAQGAGKANELLTKSLGSTEAYLRWRYIEMLEETARHGDVSRQIIYLPTEAGMPILEAGRGQARQQTIETKGEVKHD